MSTHRLSPTSLSSLAPVFPALWMDDPDRPYAWLPAEQAALDAYGLAALADQSLLTYRRDKALYALLGWSYDTFDSEILGTPCAHLKAFYAASEATLDDLTAAVLAGVETLERKGIRYIVTRTNGQDHRSHALQRAGFDVLEAFIGYGLDLRNQRSPLLTPTTTLPFVGPAREEDTAPLLTLVRESLRVGRFFRDPTISREQAEETYQRWAQNLLAGRRGDRLWVTRAHADGPPLGFLALQIDRASAPLLGPPGLASIDLIAVHPGAQKRGHGTALLHTAIDWCKNQQIPMLWAQTQLWNAPSLWLYPKLGFRPLFAGLTLRYRTKETP